jgi:Holliday junction resolvasome RuvABC endonuclease subunit
MKGHAWVFGAAFGAMLVLLYSQNVPAAFWAGMCSFMALLGMGHAKRADELRQIAADLIEELNRIRIWVKEKQ